VYHAPQTKPGGTQAIHAFKPEVPVPLPPYLRRIHCYKAVDLFSRMKPECCPKVYQIQRSRGSDRGQEIGLTKIQRQIAQNENIHVILETFESHFVLLGFEMTLPCQTHQITPDFQDKKDARQQLGSNCFPGQALRSCLTKQHTKVRRGIEI
jgi:hypothetical protein